MAKSFAQTMKARYASITSNADKLNVYIHDTAMMILQHAHDHNDCSEALNLVNAMPASYRREMVADWFAKYSPVRLNISNQKVGMLKVGAKGYVPFDIEGAAAEPFYKIAEATKEQKTKTFDDYLKLLASLPARIEKDIEKGNVDTHDIESAKALATALSGLKFTRVAQLGEKAPLHASNSNDDTQAKLTA